MKSSIIGVLLGGAVVLAAGGASAQDPSQAPNFGQVSLRAGFTPDPYVVNVTAGGSINASRLGGACVGMISSAPDFRVNYTAGGLALTMRVRSQSDVTLVINNPDGSWYCNDDLPGGTNPGVVYRTPASGGYDIWVGTFGGGAAAASISITETE